MVLTKVFAEAAIRSCAAKEREAINQYVAASLHGFSLVNSHPAKPRQSHVRMTESLKVRITGEKYSSDLLLSCPFPGAEHPAVSGRLTALCRN
jgi:hypothetical protein